MKSIFITGLTLLLSVTSTTLAQENQELGRMWTFENPPLAYLEKEFGFKPDQNWLNSLRLGSLRLGVKDVLSGFDSASFVSPKGLIMTSDRSVLDAVASTRAGDSPSMIKTGFVSAVLEQEIRLRSSDDERLTAAHLNKIWLDGKDKIDMTNDITGANMIFETRCGGQVWPGSGGSSGSVAVNKALEVVGLIVDGNIESLHNDFVFKGEVPPAVSVHVDGIMEALVKIDGAHPVAKELTGK
jgi:hypothetical protein